MALVQVLISHNKFYVLTIILRSWPRTSQRAQSGIGRKGNIRCYLVAKGNDKKHTCGVRLGDGSISRFFRYLLNLVTRPGWITRGKCLTRVNTNGLILMERKINLRLPATKSFCHPRYISYHLEHICSQASLTEPIKQRNNRHDFVQFLCDYQPSSLMSATAYAPNAVALISNIPMIDYSAGRPVVTCINSNYRRQSSRFISGSPWYHRRL